MKCARLILLLWVASAPMFAQSGMTVPQLVDFIKSSIQQHNADKDVAEFVVKLRVTNKLGDSTVEQLRAAGAGPRTVAALKKLSAASASLPPAPAPIPRPHR